MNINDALVIVIEDDSSFRRSVVRLIRAAGHEVKTFNTAMEFLRWERPDRPGCAVLDVRLPGMSGLDLQRTLTQTGSKFPLIFMTGHADISMSVQAMKGGAVEFLTKPFRDQDLLDAIQQALQLDVAMCEQQMVFVDLRTRYELLTPREREVMLLVVMGQKNKKIGLYLGISEKTVKAHRGHVMQKMQAGSLAELVRLADKLGIIGPKS